MGQITPMVADVERRTGRKAKEWLADGGCTSLADIQAAGEQGVEVLAPAPPSHAVDVDRYQPKPSDPEHVAAWRQRMGADQAQAVYRQRAASSECVNADLRTHRGRQQLPVRGIDKALTIGLWMAIACNALLSIATGPPIA